MPNDSPELRPTALGIPLSPDTTAGHGIEGVPTQAAEPVLPQRIGPYEIIKTLGRGGMSTVYLARDERDGGEVALKVIPGGPDADPTDLARFHEEAEAVARLHHPNIVRLYGVGEASGVAYLAMEYVPGGTLYKRITKGGPLSPRDAADMVEPLARAAHYAHTHGVIHRDLKPSNILLSSAESKSQAAGLHSALNTPHAALVPKIADFGLAKQLDKSLRLTQSGVALGTPHYMAPEQAHGWHDRVGPAADVYALGAILYECLIGQPPFSGSSPLETMEQVVKKQPIPPSHLRDGIPADLETICLRCLEKSPVNRFPTAGSLADALQSFLAGRPIANADDQLTERIVIARRRRLPMVLTAGGVGLVLIVLAAAVTWYTTDRAHRRQIQTHKDETEEVVRAEHRMRLEEAIARCERGDIASGLERMRSLVADDALPVREIIAAWEGRLLVRTSIQPGIRADVMAISTSGEWVATADRDVVRIWKMPGWTPVGGVWKADGDVTALAWEGGGTRLGVGTTTGRVSIGDGSKELFDPQLVVDPADLPVTAITFGSAAVRIAFGSAPLVRGYDEEDEPWTEELPAVGPVVSVAFGPGGGLTVATAGGSVKIFDADGKRWLDLPPDGDASVVAYASDGNAIAVGTKGGTVRLWDAIARVPMTDAVSVGGPVTALTVGMSTTDYTVLARGEASVVALKCARPFVVPPIRVSPGAGEEVVGIAFSSNQETLYVTAPAGVSVWQYGPGGKFRRQVNARDRYWNWFGPGRFATAIPAAVDGHESLVISGTAGRLFKVDPDRREKDVEAQSVNAGNVTAMAVGKGGKVVAMCPNKHKGTAIRLWSRGFSEAADPDANIDGAVRHSAFLPDGTAIVLGCEDGLVHITDPITGRDKREPLAGKSPVLAVAVNEDGTRILAGCADGTAHLWDWQAGTEVQVVRNRAEVRAVEFLGNDLLTASADGTARRWDATTGLPLGPPMMHADAVTALARRGSQVATGGRDRYVRIWRMP